MSETKKRLPIGTARAMLRTYVAVRPSGGHKGRSIIKAATDTPHTRRFEDESDLGPLRSWLLTFDMILRRVAAVHPRGVEILTAHITGGRPFAQIGAALGMTDAEVESIFTAAFRAFSDEVNRRDFRPVGKLSSRN